MNAKKIKKDPVKVISKEKFIEVVKQLKRLSGKGLIISFSGGEPLLYKPLFDVLEVCKRERIKFSFTTNGYLLNASNVKKIIDSNLFNIGISIESLDPHINESIRPVANGTQKVIAGIEMLIAEKEKNNSSLTINIKPVITQINYKTIPDMIQKYGKIKGVFITPQPFLQSKELDTSKDLWLKDIEQFEAVVHKVIALKKQGCSVNLSDDNLKDFIPYFKSGTDENGNFSIEMINKSMGDKKSINKCTTVFSTLFISSKEGDLEYRLCPFFKPIGRYSDGISLRNLWTSQSAKNNRKAAAKCRRYCNLACARKNMLKDKATIYFMNK